MVVVFPLVLPRIPVVVRELVTEPSPLAVVEWPVVADLPPAPVHEEDPVPPLAEWVQLVCPPAGPVTVPEASRAAAGMPAARTIPVNRSVAV